MEHYYNELIEIFQTYRGIKLEDLNNLIPWYSCVICSNSNCKRFKKGNACSIAYLPISEEEFALRYDF